MTESHVHHGDIQASSVPVGRRSVRLIELDGQALIYDDEIRRWMVLNPTASALWRCLDGSGTVAEIADDMSEVFGAEPEVVQRQVLQMVKSLGQQGLLEGVLPIRGGVEETDEAGGEVLPSCQLPGAKPFFPQVPPST